MAAATHIRLAATTHAAQALANLSIPELASLYESFTEAAKGFLNEMNMPRCRGAVSRLVEDEWERCNLLSEMVYDEMRRRTPVDPHEVVIRLKLLVTRNLGDVDNALDLVEFVYSLQTIERH